MTGEWQFLKDDILGQAVRMELNRHISGARLLEKLHF